MATTLPSKLLLSEITAKWNDDTLLETDEMYGETRGAGPDALLPNCSPGTPPRADDRPDAAGRPKGAGCLRPRKGRVGGDGRTGDAVGF